MGLLFFATSNLLLPNPDKPEPSRLLSFQFSACPDIRNQKLETNPKSECFNDQNNIRIQRLQVMFLFS